MGDKENTVAGTSEAMKAFYRNIYNWEARVLLMNPALLRKVARVAEPDLKTKFVFSEPGELGRLMDKFLEKVGKA